MLKKSFPLNVKVLWDRFASVHMVTSLQTLHKLIDGFVFRGLESSAACGGLDKRPVSGSWPQRAGQPERLLSRVKQLKRTCVSRRSSSPPCSSSWSTAAGCPPECTAAPAQRPTHLRDTDRRGHSQSPVTWIHLISNSTNSGRRAACTSDAMSTSCRTLTHHERHKVTGSNSPASWARALMMSSNTASQTESRAD